MTNPIRRDDPNIGNDAELTQDQTAAGEPSWFFDGANQPTREELMARYRKHFNLPDDGISLAPRRQPASLAPGYRDLIAAPRTAGRLQFPSTLHGEERRDPVHAEMAHQSGHGLHRTYILAALGAMLAGGSIGFVASQAHTIKLQAMAAFGYLTPDSATQSGTTVPQTATAAVAAKKPVATASLQVEDASGRVGSLIPLILRAEPAMAEQDLLLKISGLPDRAYLTSGRKQTDKVWSLSIADLKDVKLMVTGPGQPEINVAVAAFERGSGELAAPVKTMTIALTDAVIVPTASPPPQSHFSGPNGVRADLPSPIPVPMNMGLTLAALRSASQDLVSEGDIKLKTGDAAQARRIYERAWSSGSAEGAMALARSFDPIVLAQLRVKGVTPNRTQALYWYGRAAGAGHKEAYAAIVRLKVKP